MPWNLLLLKKMEVCVYLFRPVEVIALDQSSTVSDSRISCNAPLNVWKNCTVNSSLRLIPFILLS